MVHFVILFNPGFGYTKAQQVKAQKFEERGTSTRFLVNNHTVYQAPSTYIHKIIQFPNDKSAEDFIARHLSKKAGAATFHVQEYGVISSHKNTLGKARKGGFLAEGIQFDIMEFGHRPPKK